MEIHFKTGLLLAVCWLRLTIPVIAEEHTTARLGLLEVHDSLFRLPYHKLPFDRVNGKIDLRHSVFFPHFAYAVVADDPHDDSTRWKVAPGHPLVYLCDMLEDGRVNGIVGARKNLKLGDGVAASDVRELMISGNLQSLGDYFDRFPSTQALCLSLSSLHGHRSAYRFSDNKANVVASAFSQAERIRKGLQHPSSQNLFALTLIPNPMTNDLMMLEVKNLRSLRALSLFCSDVSDSSLPWLAELPELPELRVLNLDGCRITDDGVKELANVKNLQSLSLNGCRMVTDASLKAFHKHPKLMEIRAAGTQITDAAVRELHRATPNFHYAWLDDHNLPHDSKETPRFFDFTEKDKLK